MDISVIVPFRNAEAYLDRCISSLLSQSYPAEQFEVLMVDNGSTDRSVEIVREHPRVQLLSEPESGSYSARNRGVTRARGRILAFTDADCAAPPQWLQVIAAAMNDNPTVGIVQGDRGFDVASPLLRLLTVYDSEKFAFVFSGDDVEAYFASAGNLSVRRDLFDELGPFRPMRRGADVVFVQKAIRRHSCGVVLYSPSARVHHLEITGLYRWLQKMFVYGKSYEHYRTVVSCRPLNGVERLKVLGRVVRRQKSVTTLALLVPNLFLGVMCYEMGRLAGRRQERS